jgi:glycine/D-amino acid oxidase-like deaminating enzyme
MKYDIVIIGGGIAGSFAAYGAAKYGLKCIVIEASKKPNGATAVSGGIITRLLDNWVDAELADKSIRLIQELLGKGYKDYVNRGFVCIEDIDDAINDFNRFRGLISDLKLLDQWTAADNWPYLRFYDDEAALFSPSDITLEPPKILGVIWERLMDLGVEFSLGCRAKKIDIKDRGVKGVDTCNSHIETENVIVALGPWNREFLAKHGITLESWLLGVPLYRFEVNVDVDIGLWDESEYTYWRPSLNSTLVGGCYDAFPIMNANDGFRDPPRSSIENVLIEFRYRFKFDKWRLAEYWSGPISLYRRYRPFVGGVGNIDGLYVIEGLAGYGLARGPAKAVELSKYISNRIFLNTGD